MNLRSINGHRIFSGQKNGKIQQDFYVFYDSYAAKIYSFIQQVMGCEKQAEIVFNHAISEIWSDKEKISASRQTFFAAAVSIVGNMLYERQFIMQGMQEKQGADLVGNSLCFNPLPGMIAGYGSLYTSNKFLVDRSTAWHLNRAYYMRHEVASVVRVDQPLSRLQWAKRLMEQIRQHQYRHISENQTA